jgi:hypothetical protein
MKEGRKEGRKERWLETPMFYAYAPDVSSPWWIKLTYIK